MNGFQNPPLAETLDRDLATIATISSIKPIEGADSIECVRVRGWDVVVGKGEFQIGDTVVYIEVDSFLPLSHPVFAFLAPRGVRTDEQGNEGHVLKTARLRGQYSQGIVFKPGLFPELLGEAEEGTDVTVVLGITKWDPPLPSEVLDQARGFIPNWIARTKELRVQNFDTLLGHDDGNWIATEKIDGASMTVWVAGDDYGVSTRNLDLIENPDNHMWATAIKLGLHDLLRSAYPGFSAVLQGEIYGPGVIARNPLGIKTLAFAAFTIQVDGVEQPRNTWPAAIAALGVPVYELPFPKTVDDALEQVDGLRSLIAPDRAAEGVVWRNTRNAEIQIDGQWFRASMKVLSPKYLMKNDR